MVQYLKDIKFLFPLLFILLSYTANAQIYPYGFGTKGYYNYTAVTDTAINITTSSATIKGSNSRVKSDKTDPLATKRSVQNWMVYGYGDTTQQLIPNGTFSTSTGWTLGTSWSVGSGVLTRISVGMPNSYSYMTSLDTLLQNGVDKYKYSFELSGYITGTLYLFFGSEIVTFTSDGTKTGYFTRTDFSTTPMIRFGTWDGFAGSIDNFEIYYSADSSSGLSKSLASLRESTEYFYKHSILVTANDGDSDYYEGTTKTFTTDTAETMYTGTYIVTSEDKYWSTSENKLITIE